MPKHTPPSHRDHSVRHLCRIGLSLVFAFVFAMAARADIAPTNTAAANSSLQQGRVEEAATLLRAVLAANPADATAHQLLCRAFYAQEMADSAIHECEAAAAGAPANSDHQMWLGRVYGLKAEHAGPIAGLGLARKVRTAFERAVQLDPANVQAGSDLGEFYIAAPGIVGGGLEKARNLAARIEPYSVERAHGLLALIAEKQNDFAAAESELKQAVGTGRTSEAWINLAHFYEQRNRPEEALAAVRSAVAADHLRGPALVDAASILTTIHRAPELAEKALRDYLRSPARSDAAPAFKVRMQLAALLAVRGDTAGAHREYAAALALAPAFGPARKAAMAS